MVVFPNSQIKVLSYLIDNRTIEYSINLISKEIGLDYKSVNLAIHKLEQEKLIQTKKIAGSLVCKLTNNYSLIIGYVENLRRDSFLNKRQFKLIVSDLELIKKPFICLLFGSYVKGLATKNSDIDLLFITEYENDIEKVIKRFPFDIHATYVTYDEFISMANNKEFSVVLEVLKKNIILIGIEEFYRVMKHVK